MERGEFKLKNILVISDTHGNHSAIENLLKNYNSQISAVIHLGDHARDMARFVNYSNTTIYITNGNTDPVLDIYTERVIETAGKRIFITHGHFYDVKLRLDRLVYKARELKVDACLYGHTHKAHFFTENDIFFLNPGSLSHYQAKNDRHYAILHIDDDKVTGKILNYKEPVWQNL
ncbi:MAG: metallophosphoesterase [Turicibacter sp.]|nr:metallophosphoesterase [Turicibacter sp.]